MDKQQSARQIKWEMVTRGRLNSGAINKEMGRSNTRRRLLIRQSAVSLCQSRLQRSQQSSEVTADCQTLFLNRPNKPEPVWESYHKALWDATHSLCFPVWHDYKPRSKIRSSLHSSHFLQFTAQVLTEVNNTEPVKAGITTQTYKSQLCSLNPFVITWEALINKAIQEEACSMATGQIPTVNLWQLYSLSSAWIMKFGHFSFAAMSTNP